MAGSTVNWYAEKIIAIFEKASMDVLSDLAFVGEGKAKINITDNGQVDTGLMRSSVYAVTPQKSSYAPDTGLRPHARVAEAVNLPNANTVAVAVAAEYAIYQEMANPFLFTAIESLAKEFNGTVERHKVK